MNHPQNDRGRVHWNSLSQIESFVEGLLPGDVVTARTAHLAECGDCREQLARFREGLEVELSQEEQAAYNLEAADHRDHMFQEIVRRAGADTSGGGRSVLRASDSLSVVDRILGWLRPPQLYWNSAAVLAIVVLTVFLITPEVSRRSELDSLYARAGLVFPAWTGSPGRLVQPFVTPPAEPVRSTTTAPSNALTETQTVEDVLLGLELSRADEDFERNVAIATLRLSRGEIESAWVMLLPLAGEYQSPECLSALACAALASNDPQKLRAALGHLATGPTDHDVLLYDMVLLHHSLGEDQEARRVLQLYRDRVDAAAPWLSQLVAALGP